MNQCTKFEVNRVTHPLVAVCTSFGETNTPTDKCKAMCHSFFENGGLGKKCDGSFDSCSKILKTVKV